MVIFCRKLLMGTFCLCISLLSFSQESADSILHRVDITRYADQVEQKAEKLTAQLDAKTEKVLADLQKQEERIYRKLLSTKDSLAAKAKLQECRAKYEELRQKISSPLQKGSHYIPKLDSLNTSLKFLAGSGAADKVKDAIAKTDILKDKFQAAEEVKKFIRERRQQLKEQLEKLGMVKQLKKVNKQVYYYSQQINEYKKILKDSRKIEKKALELLAKTKLFQDFMKRNSLLSRFFPQPSNTTTTQSGFAGIQTRSQVTNYMLQASFSQLPVSGQTMRNSPATPFGFINNAMDKMKSASAKDFKEEMGFIPNRQKTKSFFQRIELGFQLESHTSNRLFPASTDLGINVGYKMNDKSVVGLGSSFKLGLGRSFSDLDFTGEAFTVRAFIDWKIKGSIWISGGYEQVYQSSFQRFEELRGLERWQQKGLIGITKTVPLKSKFLKKAKVQVLWDFLAYRRVPRAEVIVIRFGYSIK